MKQAAWKMVKKVGLMGLMVTALAGFVQAIDAPGVDSISVPVEADYLGTWGGGKHLDVTGSALPGATVVVIVRTGGNRYDQDPVIAGSDGRFTARAGIFGGQGQGFEINAYQREGCCNYSPESPIQATSLHLNVPTPSVDSVPSETLGQQNITITGSALPGATVIAVVFTAGTRFEHTPVVAGGDGRYSTSVGIFGGRNQSFEVFAYAKINNDSSPDSNHQTTVLKLPVSAPSVDAVTSPIQAEYLGAWGGGKAIDVTGSADPGATVIPVVRTQGNRYDQDPVVAGSDGRYSARANIFGGQGQVFEVSAYARIDGDFSAESSLQTASLHLNLFGPSVDAIPSVVESAYASVNNGGENIIVTGSAVPGSEVVVVVRTGGQRFDHPSVIAGSDGRWTSSAGILGGEGQTFEVSAYSKIGGDFSSESAVQNTVLNLNLSAPSLDAVPSPVEGDRNIGGLRINLTGSALPGAEVVGVVITAGLRFDHPSVVAGSDGRYSTEVGILGSDGQSFEVFTFAKVGNDTSADSAHQFTTLHLPPLNQAPTANAGANQTVECAGAATSVSLNGSGSSDPDGDALSYSWSKNGSVIASGANPSVSLGDGPHTITLVVNDGQLDSEPSSVVITVQDTTAPSLTVPADVTAECAGGSTSVSIGQAAVADACDASVTVTNNAPASFPMGTTIVTWTATDDAGNSSTAQQKVTVEDNTAPSLTVGDPSVTSLWAPNHSMVDVGFTGTVSDACDSSVQVNASVQVIDTPGEHTENDPDYEVVSVTNDNGNLSAMVTLRAERAGNGTGRIYRITFIATDDEGNSTSSVTEILVPHDMGGQSNVTKKK